MFFKSSGEEEAVQHEPGVVVALEPSPSTWPTGLPEGQHRAEASADAAHEPEGSKALDLLISQFSNKSVAELSSNDAREEQKKELVEKVKKAYEEEVYDVYFTEFVMQ